MNMNVNVNASTAEAEVVDPTAANAANAANAVNTVNASTADASVEVDPITASAVNTSTINADSDANAVPSSVPNRHNILMANGISAPVQAQMNSLSEIDHYLETSKQQSNSGESWIKLNKVARMRLLTEYAHTYRIEHSLTDVEYSALVDFLKESLDKKKLQRIKDVQYTNSTGVIKTIHGLFFNRASNKFTLRNLDKNHVSTLKSLGPARKSSAHKDPKPSNSRERRDCTK